MQTREEYLKLNGFKMRVGVGAKEGGCSTYLEANNLKAPDNVDWRDKGYVTPVKNQVKSMLIYSVEASLPFISIF